MIPRAALFSSERRPAPKISPDARWLGFLADHSGAPNLWVGPVDGRGFRSLTELGGRGAQDFLWSPNSGGVIHLSDAGGDENWRLHLTDLDARRTRDLTPFDGVQTQVLAISSRHPDTIVVALNLEAPARHDAYRLTLSTGALELAARNEGFTRWVVDADLRVRGAVRPVAEGGAELVVRDEEAAAWRTVLTVDLDDSAEIVFDAHPIRFSRNGRSLYLITSKDAPTSRLVRLSLETGAMTTLAEDPIYDVRTVWFHPQTLEPQAAAVVRERWDWVPCDPSIEPHIEAIRAAERGDVLLHDRDQEDRKWIVEICGSAEPGRYYLYDRQTRSNQLLFERQPGLRRQRLAEAEPFSFTARDGTTIPGYLTFPKEAAGRALPTVVKVHGGPEARDMWAFDPWLQLFADRGYLCVQVNYRASIGYGRQFLAAGRKQWGAAMHDDVVDAIRWVIDQGVADRERIAMWGTSYGGYETLWCAATEPGLLRCAVAGMAPVNLLTFLRDLPAYWTHVRAQYVHRVGNPETDEQMLRERSPLAHADRIRCPLLLFYGARDPRVRVHEAEQLTEKLRESGVEYDLHVLPDEGHFVGALSASALARVVELTEGFLARHLGGRTED